MDSFGPTDVEWRGVSAKLFTARLIPELITLVPLLLIGVVLAATVSAWAWIGVAAVLLLLVWTVWLTGRQVKAIGYAERADDLLIRRGVMFKSLVVVPYGRMQYVDVQAGPIDRALGIARVQLHTASPGTDAYIPGLPQQEATRVRERLASLGEARLAGL